MTANSLIRTAEISHQIGLARLTARQQRDALEALSEVEQKIVRLLLDSDRTDFSRGRLERLLKAVRRVMHGEYDSLTKAALKDLHELAGYEGQFQADLFKRTLPVNLNFIVPSDDQLWGAVLAREFNGRLLEQWFADLEADAILRVQRTLRQSFVDGSTIEEMIRAIRGTRATGFTDGILQSNRAAVRTLVRTAVNHTAQIARHRMYKRNERFLKGVQWLAVLDGRTSAICRSLDGSVFPVDDGPRPPAHPNCRSAVVPIVKSWRQLGLKDLPPATRASMNGQVPEDETYQTWLKKQPVAFQDDVLGKTKGRLFRRGGLTLDKFVDETGQEYNLRELRAREKEAFAKIGL